MKRSTKRGAKHGKAKAKAAPRQTQAGLLKRDQDEMREKLTLLAHLVANLLQAVRATQPLGTLQDENKLDEWLAGARDG